MTIYCGIVKILKVDSDLLGKAVDNHHMTRQEFKNLYESIFRKPPKKNMITKIEIAEKFRDRILHGKKNVSEEDKRKAVVSILEYAEAFNAEVNTIAGFKPFGPLQGFRGNARPLDKSISRWVLKGIGFSV